MIATKARTRVGFESIDKSGVTALLENGFSVTRSEYLEFLKRAEDLAPRADLVILGGSMPDRNTVGLIAAILKICSTNGIQCWVDSYGPAMERALRGSNPPQLVKPNRQEYRACPNYRKSPEIHLTDGAKTIKVTTPKGLFNVTPPKIREICPIGSGDCYLGALAHSRLLGRPIDEQLRFAAAAGTANAALGANTFIQKKDIERFENAVKIENVSFRAKPIY